MKYLVIFLIIATVVNLIVKLTKKSKGQNLNKNFKNHFLKMTKEERDKYINTLSEKNKRLFNNYINCDDAQRQNQLMQQMFQQNMINEFNQWAMNEGIRSVTPFDFGGYVMGDGFNPSDTAAADMERMNQMNNNNFNNFGGGGMGF